MSSEKKIIQSLKKSLSISILPLLNNVSTTLAPFLNNHQYWELALLSAIALYAVHISINQEEVNEFVEFIERNPEKFREEIVTSKEFQKAFVQSFELFLRERLKTKKDAIQKILIGFIDAKEKEYYELEKFNDALVKITLSCLEFLLFLKNGILKRILEEINEEIHSEFKGDIYRNSDRSEEWWIEDLILSKPINKPIEEYLHKEYSINSASVKILYKQPLNEGWDQDKQRRAVTREKEERKRVYEALTELVTLGIFRTTPGVATYGGGGGQDYRFTSFGIKFIKLL